MWQRSETMAEPPPLPHQRRRRHAFVKIASTLCLCGSLAVLVDLGADEATRTSSSLLTILKSRSGGSSSASNSATSSSARNVIGGRTGVSANNFRLLGGVNKIKPGRTLKAALLKTHLRFNPFPTTAGQQVNPIELSLLTLFSVFPAIFLSLINQLIACLSTNRLYLVFSHVLSSIIVRDALGCQKRSLGSARAGPGGARRFAI